MVHVTNLYLCVINSKFCRDKSLHEFTARSEAMLHILFRNTTCDHLNALMNILHFLRGNFQTDCLSKPNCEGKSQTAKIKDGNYFKICLVRIHFSLCTAVQPFWPVLVVSVHMMGAFADFSRKISPIPLYLHSTPIMPFLLSPCCWLI
jgi:hypothetical protein